MLRVEASNLPNPRVTPRSRRLHASTTTARRITTPSRHEILPPADHAQPPQAETLVPPAPPLAPSDRWSVRLELVDDDVAKLYGQGLARGALVWKKGMVEWRPLLITPELTKLLRRTRVTLSESSTAADASDPVTAPRLPAPARMPSDVNFSTTESGRRVPLTVSPLAIDIDVEPAAAAPSWRRRYEVAGAAVAGFALAWLSQAGLAPQASAPVSLPVMAAAAAPIAAPVAPAPSPSAASSIPLVALADLPLLGSTRATATGSSTGAGKSRGAKHAGRTGEGPARGDLLSALSRVASAASGCGERDAAVRVVITFANSGVARSINVSGKGLPSSTRSCIIGAASRARVPAFSGEPVTVSKTL